MPELSAHNASEGAGRPQEQEQRSRTEVTSVVNPATQRGEFKLLRMRCLQKQEQRSRTEATSVVNPTQNNACKLLRMRCPQEQEQR